MFWLARCILVVKTLIYILLSLVLRVKLAAMNYQVRFISMLKGIVSNIILNSLYLFTTLIMVLFSPYYFKK